MMELATNQGVRGVWVNSDAMTRLEADTVTITIDADHKMLLPTSEFMHVYRLAAVDPSRRSGDDVFVPVAWLVGDRIGY